MKFSGTLRQAFDGENTSAEGTLTLDDGTSHKLEANGYGRHAEVFLDGEEADDDRSEQICEWLAEVWPNDGWTDELVSSDRWQVQEVSIEPA